MFVEPDHMKTEDKSKHKQVNKQSYEGNSRYFSTGRPIQEFGIVC